MRLKGPDALPLLDHHERVRSKRRLFAQRHPRIHSSLVFDAAFFRQHIGTILLEKLEDRIAVRCFSWANMRIVSTPPRLPLPASLSPRILRPHSLQLVPRHRKNTINTRESRRGTEQLRLRFAFFHVIQFSNECPDWRLFVKFRRVVFQLRANEGFVQRKWREAFPKTLTLDLALLKSLSAVGAPCL